MQLCLHFIKGDSPKTSTYIPQQPFATPSRYVGGSSHAMEFDHTLARYVEVKLQGDDYEEWEVAYRLSGIYRKEYNPLHALLEKPEQLRNIVIYFVAKMRRSM